MLLSPKDCAIVMGPSMELDWLGLAAEKVSNVPVRKRHREHTIAKYLNKCKILASLVLVLEK